MHIFDEFFLKFSMLILDEFSFDFFFEQIQKWQVLAVSCIHAFSSVVNSACHRFEPVTESM